MPEYQSRLELLARVASMYYDNNKNQQEIADEIGLTRSAVSRLLSEAHKRGLVEHIVHYPWRTSRELERALAEKFQLRHAQVLLRNNKTYEEMLQGLGVLAAQYFASRLPELKIVGLSWGTGLYQMVRAVRSHYRPDMEVIQLIGGTGTEHGSAIGPLLAPNLANSLSCTCRFLHAPLLMDNEAATTALLKDRSISETFSRAALCDIALVGIGTTIPELYNAYKLGYLTLEEVEQMRLDGVIGDVACLHFDKDGNVMLDHWINKRMITVPFSAFSQIKEVMGVAGGAKKGESIYAALRGKLIHTLITDEEAAQRVLQLCEIRASAEGELTFQ
jgi:DNA-binding transcriptional regulator LsrR (DeoR family)